MHTAYTFVWLSNTGQVAAVDSADRLGDAEAVETARALFRDDGQSGQGRNCARIEIYQGTRFIEQVQRISALSDRV